MFPYERPVPLATVERLSVYLKTLQQHQKLGHSHISSSAIAEEKGYTPAQVRKDLTCFGSFGRKGQGYPIKTLIKHIESILGIDTKWKICLIGFGRLGLTLTENLNVFNENFRLVSIFEKNDPRIGTEYNGIPILDESVMAQEIREKNIEIGILTVPEESAENAMRILIEGGIKGIVNFTSIRIPPPDGVYINDVNIGAHINTVTFYLNNPNRRC